MKKFKVLISVLLVLVMTVSVVGCYKNKVDNTTTEVVEEETTLSDIQDYEVNVYDPDKPVTVPKEAVESAKDTKEDIKEGEDLSTDEVIEATPEDEKKVSDLEGAVEPDANSIQGEVAYEGTNTGKGTKLLGSWQGLTYYAQTDSRWSNILYTSCGNRSQTIGSSACGPTSAAMVVSSSKGAILPTTMCSLYVANGYRTRDNGTAWSAMSFTADYFDFNYFAISYSYSEAFSYLRTDKNKDGVSDYFVVCACGPGLWTSSGHYIAVMNDSGGTLRVHDPYPYSGKYNTASRRGANVQMSGNIAYVTESKFKSYSNVNCFFIFSNDHSGKASPETKVNYTRYVATESLDLNVRSGPGSGYSIVGALKKGTKVTVTAVSGGWSKIGTSKWVSSSYLSSTPVNSGGSSSGGSSSKTSYKTKVNSTYKLKSAANLYSKSNLTGTKYDYKKNTTVKVLSHASAKVDYVLVVATGRKAYINVSYLVGSSSSSSSSTSYKSVIGNLYRLKSYTTLYSNSNLTGTQYQYYAQTQIKVIKHASTTVDYIYVVKTGRYAYCKVSAFI